MEENREQMPPSVEPGSVERVPSAFPFAEKSQGTFRDEAPTEPFPKQLSVAALRKKQAAPDEMEDMPAIDLVGGMPPPPPVNPRSYPAAPAWTPPPSPASSPDFDPWATPQKPQSVIKPLALLAGIGAGVAVGALWFLVTWMIGYQWPGGTWAIGAAVGYCAMLGGGRGFRMGLLCVLVMLPLAAAGRVAAYHPVQHVYQARLGLKENSTMKRIESLNTAPSFAAPSGRSQFEGAQAGSLDDMKRFMISREQLTGLSADDILDEEAIAYSRDYQAALDEYDQEREKLGNLRSELKEIRSYWGVFFRTISTLDIIFLLFGIASAYAIGGAKDGDL